MNFFLTWCYGLRSEAKGRNGDLRYPIFLTQKPARNRFFIEQTLI